MFILLIIFIALTNSQTYGNTLEKAPALCNANSPKKSNLEISLLLKKLEKNFKSLKSRQLNPTELIRELDEILAKTEYARLLSCKKIMDHRTVKKEIQFVTSKNGKNHFAVESKRDNNNSFEMKLIFDLKLHPYSSLFFYAHELFHWCRETKHHELRINNPEHSKNESEVEEIVAKKMEIDLFSYISAIEPDVCKAPGPVFLLSKTYNGFQERISPFENILLNVPWNAYLDGTTLNREEVDSFAERIKSIASQHSESNGKIKKLPSPSPPSSNKIPQEVNR